MGRNADHPGQTGYSDGDMRKPRRLSITETRAIKLHSPFFALSLPMPKKPQGGAEYTPRYLRHRGEVFVRDKKADERSDNLVWFAYSRIEIVDIT
jgi:hypothetical protein